MRVVAAPDLETRDQLVLSHVGLVKALAVRLAQRVPSQVEVSELVSVGMMGLIEAAQRFNPATGVPFDAFARRRIHGAMMDSLRSLDWAPRSVRRLRRDVDAAIGKLRHVHGREPHDHEIAAALSVSEAEYVRMLDQLRATEVATLRQLDAARMPEAMEIAVDDGDSPEMRIERAEIRAHLAQAVGELPERERQILSMYYEHELTLAEIGAVIGVGESRVSQLRTQAIARLRSRLRQALQLGDVR